MRVVKRLGLHWRTVARKRTRLRAAGRALQRLRFEMEDYREFHDRLCTHLEPGTFVWQTSEASPIAWGDLHYWVQGTQPLW